MVAVPKYEDVLLRRGCVLTGINGGREAGGWRLAAVPWPRKAGGWAWHHHWRLVTRAELWQCSPVSSALPCLHTHIICSDPASPAPGMSPVYPVSIAAPVILPTREIVRPSSPRAHIELLANVGDMFLRQRSEISCQCCVMSYFIHTWPEHLKWVYLIKRESYEHVINQQPMLIYSKPPLISTCCENVVTYGDQGRLNCE